MTVFMTVFGLLVQLCINDEIKNSPVPLSLMTIPLCSLLTKLNHSVSHFAFGNRSMFISCWSEGDIVMVTRLLGSVLRSLWRWHGQCHKCCTPGGACQEDERLACQAIKMQQWSDSRLSDTSINWWISSSGRTITQTDMWLVCEWTEQQSVAGCTCSGCQ